MNYQTTAESLRTFVLTAWALSSYSAVPIYMEDRTVADLGATAVAVQMHVVPVDRQVVGYGTTKLWRTFGEVMFNIMVPNNTGDAVARQIADVLGGFLEGQLVSGISCRAALYVGEILSDGKWTTYQLRVSYDVDELH